jgi:hypothetical protein
MNVEIYEECKAVHVLEKTYGGLEVWLHSFTSAIVGGEESASRRGLFVSWERALGSS